MKETMPYEKTLILKNVDVSENDKAPIISIIVPFYNASLTLGRLLESIRKQTFPNFEVIGIDDGSADDSSSVFKRFRERDPRFVLLRQDNKGQSAARSAGLRIARGSFVTFADADDFVDTRWLSLLHTTITKYNADISMCAFYNYSPESHRYYPSSFPSKNVVWDKKSAMSAWLTDEEFKSFLWNKLYKKTLLDRIDMSPDFNFMEDVYINGQALKFSEVIASCQEVGYYYVVNPQSKMHSSFLDQDAKAFYFLTDFIRIASNEQNLQDVGQIRTIKIAMATVERMKKNDLQKNKKLIFEVYKQVKSLSPTAFNYFKRPTQFFLVWIKLTGKVFLPLKLRRKIVIFRDYLIARGIG
ncbi:glycosyltransferase family 2 protein [Lacticaseibacillus paracasei]|uniref:glycosyltransferase family 2 protein n=1 Tax=Lacticaseibacillus paracasei TaxID=1597 RepID=UPI0021A84C2D|nr:glycosyltransferase family 2 protein [Lacticaseibacillus paracasei]MCT3377997.1 glycosyltransferase family 2 protein [Lacticaseibacillus paracasei]QHV91379.1 glycosyl transferase [Lacticaseibacillus paracasei]